MRTFFRSLPVNLLVLLFIYAALSKLADVQSFRGQLHNQPFPGPFADLLLYLLPGLELLAVALLVREKTELPGLVLSLGLMVIFTGYISLVLLNFWDRIPCSCGGVLSKMGWRPHLFFNIFFLLLNLLAIKIHLRTTGNKGNG